MLAVITVIFLTVILKTMTSGITIKVAITSTIIYLFIF
jgi:hypothetical protein